MNRYTIAIILGMFLTPFAIHASYIQRGYWAFGGEYLLPVLFMLVVWVVDGVKEELKRVKIHS